MSGLEQSAEQAPQLDLLEKATLTSEPIKVPNMMAWRWRVEHVMLEAGMHRYPSYNLAEEHAYFFENWGYASIREWDVRFTPTDKAISDFPIEFSEGQRAESDQATLPLLSDLLGDNYPVFLTEPSDRHVVGKKLKGFVIQNPLTLVNALAENTTSINVGRRSVHFEKLRDGITIALAKTQDGSIYSIGGNHDSLVEPDDTGLQSFNSFLEQAGMCETDEEREGVTAIYLRGIKKASIKDIVGRAVLHRQYSDVLETIGEGFQALAEKSN